VKKTIQDCAGACGPNHAKERLKSSAQSKIPVIIGPKLRHGIHQETVLIFTPGK
jgi:hypothetical protein